MKSTSKILFIVLSAFIIALTPILSLAVLPQLGDPTQKELSPGEEKIMGKKFFRAVKNSVPLVHDLLINDYITNLGQKLVSQSSMPDYDFNFFVLKINSINAFAGPDAQIGIHSGLFLESENESQLAGVLAHEVSHVTQRHLARAITESNSSPAVIFATVLAGILLSTQNPEAGAAVIYGGTAALMQSQINFTRHNEYEADRIGISLLRKAQISPWGMADFFETLLSKADSNSPIARIEYLRTHPLNYARIAEAKHRINDNDKILARDSLNFQLSKARLLVSSNASLQDLITLLKAKNKKHQSLSSSYALAIALIAYDQAGKAIEILTSVIDKADHPWFQLALAKAYEKNNQHVESIKILENLIQLLPNYLPVSIEYANHLNHFKHYNKAIDLLKTQLQHTKHADVYQTLAQSYYSNGQITSALEATSYQYEMEGYLNLAAQQLANALKQPDLQTSTVQRLESRRKILIQSIQKERKY